MNVTDPLDDLTHFERVEEHRVLEARAHAGRAFVMRGARVALAAASGRPVVAHHSPGDPRTPHAFLGLDGDGGPLYVHLFDDDAPDADVARLGLDPSDIHWDDLRMHLGRYAPAEREALVTALALARWSRSMRFCPACARALVWDRGGRTKSCTREPNAHRHFPRTDPATIVLVYDGARVLLGRQATWPPGMYSTLAGFVEVGETAEGSVTREVFEEVGVRVDDVRYVASEAWPFPRSLMLGFTARAQTFDVRIGDELEDARWFTQTELAAMQAQMTTARPYFDTIARRLMAGWLAERLRTIER